jgi:hypothetical protein
MLMLAEWSMGANCFLFTFDTSVSFTRHLRARRTNIRIRNHLDITLDHKAILAETNQQSAQEGVDSSVGMIPALLPRASF